MAAARKPKPEPDDVLVEEVTEEGAQRVDLLGEFPLADGHYFHPPVVSPRAHDGSSIEDRAALRTIQQVLGVPESGVYDDVTASALRAWVVERALPTSLVIDSQTWELLREGQQ